MKHSLLVFCCIMLWSCQESIVLPLPDMEGELHLVPFSAAEKPFAISRTELSYTLWYRVRQWAEGAAERAGPEHNYQFSFLGAEGSRGIPGVPPQSTLPQNATADSKPQPVSQVSWGDAIIWCNALSEYYNWQLQNDAKLKERLTSAGMEPHFESVYRSPDGAILRSAEQANAGNLKRLETASGFRLPSEREWLWASQANQANQAIGNPRTVARYAENSAGHSWPVASRRPTKAGLFDMQGNVAEWVEYLYAEGIRTLKGGAYFSPLEELQLELSLPALPRQTHKGIGFRVAFSQNAP